MTNPSAAELTATFKDRIDAEDLAKKIAEIRAGSLPAFLLAQSVGPALYGETITLDTVNRAEEHGRETYGARFPDLFPPNEGVAS